MNLPNLSQVRPATTPVGEDDDTDGATVNTKRIRMTKGIERSESRAETRSESAPPEHITVAKSDRVSSDSTDDGLLDIIDLDKKPNRHINTDRKAIDWSINIRKPIVFMGDSNLSRIPVIKNPNTQVDSFPGANFLHMAKILQKQNPHPLVHKVILSGGLNNRGQHPHKTAIKQLQCLWRTAQSIFPNATINTPVIQFSESLPLQEQQNLEVLNKYIVSHGSPLWELNRLFFRVERDHIHWTAETAQRMFDGWCDQLNY